MAIKNTKLGGTDWGTSVNTASADLNDTFDAAAQNSPFYSPVGCLMAWLKNFGNTPSLPSGWVECNGQTLSDADSVFNGQVIPNLNGDNRFLRGNATSGGTGGADTHTHTSGGGRLKGSAQASGSGGINLTGSHWTNGVVSSDHKPKYYDVVMIMRVK